MDVLKSTRYAKRRDPKDMTMVMLPRLATLQNCADPTQKARKDYGALVVEHGSHAEAEKHITRDMNMQMSWVESRIDQV